MLQWRSFSHNIQEFSFIVTVRKLQATQQLHTQTTLAASPIVNSNLIQLPSQIIHLIFSPLSTIQIMRDITLQTNVGRILSYTSR